MSNWKAKRQTGIACPACGGKTHIVQVITAMRQDAVRRLRLCSKCKKKFTTWEAGDGFFNYVVKRDGSTQRFSRDKVMRSIEAACYKRKPELRKLQILVKGAEALVSRQPDRTLLTSDLARHVASRIKLLDHVAWLRYVSFYPELQLEDAPTEEANWRRPAPERVISAP
jgi:transcriptional repressor NrdR